MHWRRAARRGGKWACAGAGAACLVGFGVSMFWDAEWSGQSSRWLVEIACGRIEVCRTNAPLSPLPWVPGFYHGKHAIALRRMVWWPEIENGQSYGSVITPLWIPFLLTAIPAACLWRVDHRAARLARAGA